MPRVGTFISLGSPQVTEIITKVFPLIIVDAEHGLTMGADLEHLLRAVDRDCIPWIRVPHINDIGHALDYGARGILLPQIRSLADVTTAVQLSLYPPRGTRGWGPGRAALWGRHMDHLLEAERSNELWVQIETKEALTILPDVARCEGVHGLFLGPGDLSMALGIPGQWEHPLLQEIVQEIRQACEQSGKKFGMFLPTMKNALASIDADLVIVGSDASWLWSGLQGFMAWKEA